MDIMPSPHNIENPPALYYWAGVAGAITCLFLWSGWLVLSRFGLSAGIGVIDLAFLRYGVAIIAVSPFIWKLWPRHVHWKWQVALAMTSAGYPYAILSFAGLQIVEISEAGIFQNGFIPVMAAIFVWLFDSKKPSLRAVIGMLIILVGCIMLAFKSGYLHFLTYFGLGHLYLLMTAGMIGFYTAIAARTGIKPLQIVVLAPTYNGIIAVIVWLIWGNHDLLNYGYETLMLQGLYQGIGPSIFGVLGYFLAIQYFGKAETASVMAGVPALATCMAIPFLNEYPSFWGWAGIGFVSFGILLIVRQKKSLK